MLQRATENTGIPADIEFNNWINEIAYFVDFNNEIVSIRVVDSPESQRLNLQFRGIDKATNVLSFPADLPAHAQEKYLGDIIICANIVEQEALAQQKEIKAHWAHMLVHGALHLHGYDHIEPDQAETMEAFEAKILSKMGFPNPYHVL